MLPIRDIYGPLPFGPLLELIANFRGKTTGDAE
jgi:hypothetical protein